MKFSCLILIIFNSIVFVVKAELIVEKINFHIVDTEAKSAILNLAQQAKLTFFVSYKLLQGIKTKPLIGEYTIKQAVKLMFEGTNLVATYEGGGNFKLNSRKVEDLIKTEKFYNNEIEKIEITGIYNHLDLKKNTENITEVIDGKALTYQANKNVAESLQRKVGVNVHRISGEGADVSVRGFGPNFNTITIDGRTIATNAEHRGFDFRLFPTDFFSMVLINKSPNADTTAGSIGANIELITKFPNDYSELLGVTDISLNYNKLSSKHDFSLSGLFSDKFLDDTVGLLIGFSSINSHDRFDRYSTRRIAQSNTLPENLQLPVNYIDGNIADADIIRRPLRMRYDVQLSEQNRNVLRTVIQYSPNNWLEQTWDFWGANYKKAANTSGIQIPGQSPNYKGVIIDNDNTLIFGTIFNTNLDAISEQENEKISTFASGYNSKVSLPNWLLNIDVSYSRAKTKESLNSQVPHYTIDGEARLIDLDFSQGNLLSMSTTIPTDDASLIKAHWNGNLYDVLEDEVKEFKFDGIYSNDIKSIKYIQLGMQFLQREKSKRHYKWNDKYQCAPCGGIADLPSELFDVVEYKGFMGKDVIIHPTTWLKLNNLNAYNNTIQTMLENQGAISGSDYWNHTVFDPSASYVNEEMNLAFYVDISFLGEYFSFDWSGNLGVRALFLNTKSKGFIQNIEFIGLDPSSSENELRLKLTYSDPIASYEKSNYEYLLPSGNLNLRFDNNWLMRFSAANVVSFAPIEAIGVNQQVFSDDTGTLLLSGGNPKLKPYIARQYDFSLEYDSNESSLSAGLFYKKINTHITISTFENIYQGDVSDDVLERIEEITEIVNQSENISGGKILGGEFSANLDLSFMCDFCNVFNLNLNYIKIFENELVADSIALDSVKEPKNIIEGLSEEIFGLNLMIQSKKLTSYIGWSWHDSFLHTRQGIRTGGIPEHTLARGQLDARVSYKLSDLLAVYLEAYNLTKEPYIEYADIRSRTSYVEYSGTLFKLGLIKKW
jgi:iron complex outermembrane receptor protein